MNKPIIGILDIETSLAISYHFQMWKVNVRPEQIIEQPRILSVAFKVMGEDKTTYLEARKPQHETALVKKLSKFIGKCDAVVAHNGDRFDLAWIRGRCLILGLPPFAPTKQIDTLKIAKTMNLPHRSLEWLSDQLGCANKLKHDKFPGISLWIECMKGNDEAWKEMKTYNIQDVDTLEELYLKLRPFHKNGPNLSVLDDDETPVCPRCGGKHLHKRGVQITGVGRYQRFRCVGCGAWSRDAVNLLSKGKRAGLLRNAA